MPTPTGSRWACFLTTPRPQASLATTAAKVRASPASKIGRVRDEKGKVEGKADWESCDPDPMEKSIVEARNDADAGDHRDEQECDGNPRNSCDVQGPDALAGRSPLDERGDHGQNHES